MKCAFVIKKNNSWFLTLNLTKNPEQERDSSQLNILHTDFEILKYSQ